METKMQQFFLQCLSDFLREQLTGEAEGTLDWDELFQLAASHSVSGIVYHQCSEVFPESIKRKYLKPYLSNVFYSIQREKSTAELIQKLERENISAVYIKGSVFRDHYPVQSLRSMGDIDIVIRHEDRNRVDQILKEEMGYDCFVDNHAVWTYWKGNLYFEVHDHMFYEDLANKIDYRGYFDQLWDHCHNAPVFGTEASTLYVPDEDFHLLYLMAHTAKHIMNAGSGFRAYLDMVLMVRNCANQLDWKHISEELDKLKLLTFTKTCFSCCEKWFGVEMPLRLERLDDSLYEAITEKTFRDGAFGLQNAENKPAMASKDIQRTDGTYFFGAVKRVFLKLFPPYRDMQLVKWYSFVDGRPWLLPAAWVYRWFYCAGKKLKHSMRLISEPFMKKKEVLERQNFMKQWGL